MKQKRNVQKLLLKDTRKFVDVSCDVAQFIAR